MADSRQPLHDRAARAEVHRTLLERDYGEGRRRQGGEGQQFILAQQEFGIGGPAERFVAKGERLVQQHAVWRERRAQVSKQRPVQVIRHDDRVEAFSGKRPRARLQVAGADDEPRIVRQRCERLRIAIGGDDLRAARGE